MKTEQTNISRNDFCNVINQNNYKIGVEIGTARGDYSKYLLTNSSLNVLYSIDPFIIEAEGYYNDQSVSIKTLLPFTGRSVIIPMYSENAVLRFEDNYIDFIYIDGDHRRESVKKDLELWYPKVKTGGFFSGHDYHHSQPGVVEAVDAFCIDHSIETLYITSLSSQPEEVSGKEGGARSWFFVKGKSFSM